MPIPNAARKAIYMRFLERIKDKYLSCLDLLDPPDLDLDSRARLLMASAKIERDGSITDLAFFDANPNLAVILTADPDPKERFYYARRLPPGALVGNEPKMFWTCPVQDEVTFLDSTRITSDNEKFDEPTDGRWVRLAVRIPGARRTHSAGRAIAGSVLTAPCSCKCFTEVGERMRGSGLYSPGNRRCIRCRDFRRPGWCST